MMTKVKERKARKPRATSYGHGYNSDNAIAIIWCIDDVRQVIDSNESLNFLSDIVTDDDCMNVLYQCEDNHDANYGISWDSIYYVLLDFYSDEIKEEEARLEEEKEKEIREPATS